MQRLAPNQANGPAFPAVTIFTLTDGILTDPFALSFQVWDVSTDAALASPVLKLPTPSDPTVRSPVDLVATKLHTGHFAPVFTLSGTPSIGEYELRVFVTMVQGEPEVQFRQAFELASFTSGPFECIYSSVSSMRNEGILQRVYGDRRVYEALRIASDFFDSTTQRFFEPRWMQVNLDGQGTPVVNTRYPIIAIGAVKSDIFGTGFNPVEAGRFRVYNRHLSGFINPDDRDYPRIELLPGWSMNYLPWPGDEDFVPVGGSSLSTGRLWFPKGVQNVQVSGIFGYTDPDGSSAGRTPYDVAWAVRRLARRYLPAQNKQSLIDSMERSGLVTSESTRDQSYTIAAKNVRPAPFTGDAAIDAVLLKYLRPFASSVG